MKTINIILLICCIIFAACTFKHKAENRISPLVESVVTDQDFSIEKKTVEYESDSICIIRFYLNISNHIGGYDTSDCEYLLVQTKSSCYERLHFLDGEPSTCERARESCRKLGVPANGNVFEANVKAIAVIETVCHGRKVVE